MAKKKHRSPSTGANSQRRVVQQTGNASGSSPVRSREQQDTAITTQKTSNVSDSSSVVTEERTEGNATPKKVEKLSSNAAATSVAERRRERVASQRTSHTSRSAPSASEKRRRAVRKSWWQRYSFVVIGGILLVLAITIGTFVVIANAPSSQVGKGVIGPSNPDILKKVTTIKQSVFANVNTGGVQNVLQPATGNPPPLKGTHGKPEVFFYGAEFCPLCAADRWSVAIALSRFGTFSQLPLTVSADPNLEATLPDIPTFTFRGSTYTSKYIDFASLEAETRTRQTLDTPSTEQQQLLTEFKVGGYPFIDIGNKYTVSTVFYDPSILKGLSQQEIANMLSDQTQGVTQNIVGAANYVTAAICVATNNQPASVCTSDPIKSLTHFLTTNATASVSSPSPVSFIVANCQGEPATCRRRGNMSL